ncbi:MAG: thiamine pyrophosphate-binding protein [Acidimicrobiales bacterium]
MKAAASFLDVLDAAGVDTFFGLPGSTEAPLLEALRDRDFRYVLALHEGVAVSMADGYARMHGGPGVVGLHTSVGTLNGLSQMMNALRDGTPLVVTAGHKDRQVLSEDGFCALPELLSAARAVTKWAHQSLSPASVAADLAHAIRVACAPPPGPTYLAVPEDLLAAEVDADAGAAAGIVTAPPVRAVPSAEAVRAAVDRLLAAERPVLVVGSAAREARTEVADLTDQCGLAVLHAQFSDLADLPVPTADRSYLGMYGEDPQVLDGCDLVVAAGCRVFYPFSAATRPRLPAGAALVHLHDDPTQVGRVTRADVGLLGDVRAGLSALADEVRRRGMDQDRRAHRRARLDQLADRRRQAKAAEVAAAAGASPLRIEELATVLGDVLPDDAVVVDEGVRSSRPLLRHLPLGPAQRVLRSSGGALGWGTPAAVGAKLGAPARPVVAVVGDGSFQFSVQALWSAVQAGAALTVVVLDNGGYLAVKRAIEGHLGVPQDPRVHPGTEITGIDHAEIARGYGARTVSPVDADSFRKGLFAGLESDGVTVVHVPVAQVRP